MSAVIPSAPRTPVVRRRTPAAVRFTPEFLRRLAELLASGRDEFAALLFGKRDERMAIVEALHAISPSELHLKGPSAVFLPPPSLSVALTKLQSLAGLQGLELLGWCVVRSATGLVQRDMETHNRFFRRLSDLALILVSRGKNLFSFELYTRSLTGAISPNNTCSSTTQYSLAASATSPLEVSLTLPVDESLYLKAYTVVEAGFSQPRSLRLVQWVGDLYEERPFIWKIAGGSLLVALIVGIVTIFLLNALGIGNGPATTAISASRVESRPAARVSENPPATPAPVARRVVPRPAEVKPRERVATPKPELPTAAAKTLPPPAVPPQKVLPPTQTGIALATPQLSFAKSPVPTESVSLNSSLNLHTPASAPQSGVTIPQNPVFTAPRPIREATPALKRGSFPRQELSVPVQLKLDATGNVLSAAVLAPPGTKEAIVKAARNAAEQWSFVPASLRGKSVPSTYTLTFHFPGQSDKGR